MNYKTVSKEGEAEIIRMKSRFIANVFPVSSENEAIECINKIKKLHPAATHHVYAYLCREQNAQRYSDDGEPASTAGLPVLDVIRRGGLTDICIVVTRYFGGTLLGTGGLVRAYGNAATEGVKAAGVSEMIYSEIYEIVADYAMLGKLQYEIAEQGYKTLSTNFGETVTLTVCTEEARGNELVSKITEASFGKVIPVKIDTTYVPSPCDI